MRIPGARGIEPDLAWDDDGTCYMTYAGFTADGEMGIAQSVVDPLTCEVLTRPAWLWGSTGGKYPEGPHLYHVHGSWYLLIAEGGTERGHAATIARGPSPRGPFVGYAGNPILTRRSTERPCKAPGTRTSCSAMTDPGRSSTTAPDPAARAPSGTCWDAASRATNVAERDHLVRQAARARAARGCPD